MKPLDELLDVVTQVNQVFTSEALSWEAKYDLIFSETLSQRVFDLSHLDYYDPDTTYQEDVEAFVNAVNQHVKVFVAAVEPYVKAEEDP